MKNFLKIENDYSQLITQDNMIRYEIFQKLRFRDRNYFHSRAYKQRKWDGYISFFSKDTGKFLTGLLPEVTAVLKYLNCDFETLDQRSKTSFLNTEVTQNFLNQWLPDKDLYGDPMKPVSLYDYQVEYIQQVRKYKRGIIFAPTSAGKSLVMLGIAKIIPPDTPTLILQNRVDLARQNYDAFSMWQIPGLGKLWGGEYEAGNVMVASVQSISKIENELPKFKAIIVDEIHDMMSNTPKAVYKKLKNADIRIAVSATPFKHGGKDKVQKFYVKGFFGPIFKISSVDGGVLTTKELQNRGILSQSDCVFYKIETPDLPYDIYLDAVTHGIAENYFMHNMVVDLVNSLKGRTLILVDRIAQGDALHKMLPQSLWIQGSDNAATRKKVIRELQKSEKCIAIATHYILNTGINFFVHNLINAGGGSADHQIIQRMGRGLRIAHDKEILKYFDFYFKINPYLEKHSKSRINVLKTQGHNCVVKDYPWREI